MLYFQYGRFKKKNADYIRHCTKAHVFYIWKLIMGIPASCWSPEKQPKTKTGKNNKKKSSEDNG